jgi:hypothetical protein
MTHEQKQKKQNQSERKQNPEGADKGDNDPNSHFAFPRSKKIARLGVRLAPSRLRRAICFCCVPFKWRHEPT